MAEHEFAGRSARHGYVVLVHEADPSSANLVVDALIPLAGDDPIEGGPATTRSQSPFTKLLVPSLQTTKTKTPGTKNTPEQKHHCKQWLLVPSKPSARLNPRQL